MTEGVLGVCLGGFMVAVGADGDREGLVKVDRAIWQDARAWRVPFGG
jgi:hypothetical protein